jgi:GAF domain-containing protein
LVRLGRRRQEIPDVAAEAGSADVDAVAKVVAALRGQQTVEDVARAALDAVREAFGWAYGSVWGLDTTGLQPAMRFLADSGHVNAEFERVTLSTAFVEGQGIVGRAWRSHDLVFVRDLAEVDDCPRAPVARRAGVRSGVCFPLVWQGRVQATMDFFTTVYLEPVPSRLEALRTVGVVVSQALEAIALADVERARAEELAAVTEVLRSLTAAASEDDAVRGALDAVRAEFGWQYGSFWRIADGDNALRFAVAKRISAIQEQAHQATEMLRMIEQAVNEAGQVQTRITEITGEQLMVAGTLQNR